MAQSPYLKLEKRIGSDERDSITCRWRYGRELLKAKGARKKLPEGLATELIVDALRSGIKISEREIRYRVQCATVYANDQQIGKAIAEWGTWFGLIQAGFPAVDIDEEDLDEVDEMEEVGLSADAGPDAVQDPLFEIPGFKPVLKIHGRKTDLDKITVGDAVAYRDMCREMHANFGRTVVQIEASVSSMLAGSGGDLAANALEAYRLGSEPLS